MKKLMLVLMALSMFAFIGCGDKGAVNDVVQKAAISSAAYAICKNNPEAIPAIKPLCEAPQEQLADALAELIAKYDGAIEDPFLKMQANIILKAFMDEYGVDLLDPDLDLSAIDLEEIQPFIDAVCAGVTAAELAR